MIHHRSVVSKPNPRCYERHRLWIAAVCWLLIPISLFANNESEFECSVSAVSCGAYVTSTTESQVCGVIELVKVGDLTAKQFTQLSLFLGVRAGSEMLFIGGANVKGGIAISCKVPWDPNKNGPDYQKLKQELPGLLMMNPQFKASFPNITEIELDKKLSLPQIKPADVERIRTHDDFRRHRWWK